MQLEYKMLDRTQKNDQLTTALTILSVQITNKGKQGMLDDNRVIEIILPKLLNDLYGYQLKDLNAVKYNHPAIDLGDPILGKAFQITSDGSKSKMVETIEMLEKHKLNDTYTDITFLIISNSPRQSFQKKGYTVSVKDLGDIAKDICLLPSEKFNEIFDYCKENFGDLFLNKIVKLTKPKSILAKDPNSNISKFLECNGFAPPFGDDFTALDMRNGLVALKEQLSQLNENQRWFIVKVLKYTLYFGTDPLNEFCIAPYHHIVDDTSDGLRDIVKHTFKSLECIKMANFDDEAWNFDFPYFSVRYFNDVVEDYNFFSGICTFIKKEFKSDQMSDRLSKIIMDCDFSDIN